jgi:hypothetical protein
MTSASISTLACSPLRITPARYFRSAGCFQDEEKDGRALTCCAAEHHLQYRVFSKVPLWLPPILLSKNLFRQSVVFLAIIFHRRSSSAAYFHTPAARKIRS